MLEVSGLISDGEELGYVQEKGFGVCSLNETVQLLTRTFYGRASKNHTNPLVIGLEPGDSWKRTRLVLQL